MKHYWIIALENILMTAIFAGVAVYFGKWWIVLFAILGWTRTIKSKENNK